MDRPEQWMVNRLATVQCNAATRRWVPSAVVTLAAMLVVTALSTEAAARQARPTEAAAPRAAGEPIMAVVSINTQHVTFYHSVSWTLPHPASTAPSGSKTPAGVFFILEKAKDHH